MLEENSIFNATTEQMMPSIGYFQFHHGMAQDNKEPFLFALKVLETFGRTCVKHEDFSNLHTFKQIVKSSIGLKDDLASAAAIAFLRMYSIAECVICEEIMPKHAAVGLLSVMSEFLFSLNKIYELNFNFGVYVYNLHAQSSVFENNLRASLESDHIVKVLEKGFPLLKLQLDELIAKNSIDTQITTSFGELADHTIGEFKLNTDNKYLLKNVISVWEKLFIANCAGDSNALLEVKQFIHDNIELGVGHASAAVSALVRLYSIIQTLERGQMPSLDKLDHGINATIQQLLHDAGHTTDDMLQQQRDTESALDCSPVAEIGESSE